MKREFTHLMTGIKPKTRPSIWLVLICMLLSFGTLELKANNSSFEPCCMIPHDRTIGCDVLDYGFDPYDIWQLQQLFGAPHAYGSCPNYYVTELQPYVYLNSCDLGTITRRFEIVNPYDWSGEPYICTQTVTIEGAHDYNIRFPADQVAYCTTPEPEPIQYNEFSCDLLAVSTNDLIFNTATDACYKIFRTYRVINWCEYDGISAPIVIGRDEDCDGVPGDEAVWVQRRLNDIIYTDRTNNLFDNNPHYGELDPSCGHEGVPGYWRRFFVAPGYPYHNSRGFFQYTQHIKVTDDTKPEVRFSAPDAFCSLSNNIAAGCPGDVEIPFNIEENCTNQATIKIFFFENNVPVPLTAYNDLFDEIVTGSFPNYVISGDFPIGSHAFEVHVNDGCGNSNSALIPFQVVDCKAPAPICIHGLSSSLMPLEPGTDADGDGDVDDGAMAIWASDFIGSPIYDCSGPVTYSINRVGETPNRDQDGIVLTCDDLDTAYVELYAWDNAFNPYAVQPDGSVGGANYDHCKTYIRLTDNLGLCPNVVNDPHVVTLLGAIHTEQDSMLDEVAVYLEGDESDMIMTEEDGAFEFEDLEMGMDYEVRPTRDDDHANGLSTADLIILGKHLMGADTLDSPYLLIAADVDNNSVVDINDFLVLRRVILGQDSAFYNNTSWRFILDDFEFADDTDPWLDEFPEYISFDSLEEDQADLDFVAIKIGDLDGSVVIKVEEEALSVQRADIAKRQKEDLSAIEEALGIAQDIADAGNTSIASAQLSMKPAWPNPFSHTTNIAFYVSEPGQITLTVMDLTGRVIKSASAYYEVGEYTEQINLGGAYSAGIYYVRLQSGSEVQSQKIMLSH
jgi:hypothetical protein